MSVVPDGVRAPGAAGEYERTERGWENMSESPVSSSRSRHRAPAHPRSVRGLYPALTVAAIASENRVWRGKGQRDGSRGTRPRNFLPEHNERSILYDVGVRPTTNKNSVPGHHATGHAAKGTVDFDDEMLRVIVKQGN